MFLGNQVMKLMAIPFDTDRLIIIIRTQASALADQGARGTLRVSSLVTDEESRVCRSSWIGAGLWDGRAAIQIARSASQDALACASPAASGGLELAMAGQQRQAVPQPPTEQMGRWRLIVRMVWWVAGNLAVLGCALSVAKGTAPVVMDVVFFAVAIGLVAVRYMDIAHLKGHTSGGKPATLADWRRYAVMMAVIAAGLWRSRESLLLVGGCRCESAPVTLGGIR